MVDVGLGWSSILGVLHILGSVAYFVVSIVQITVAARSRQPANTVLRILQLIFAPLILLLSGFILFFQGWRQDPILQFQQLLMNILIGYLIFLDLKTSNRTI